MRRSIGLVSIHLLTCSLRDLGWGLEGLPEAYILHQSSFSGSRGKMPLNGPTGFHTSDDCTTVVAVLPGTSVSSSYKSPSKKILQRSDVSNQLMNWAIELSEFNIEYIPRKYREIACDGKLRSRVQLLPRRGSRCTSHEALIGLHRWFVLLD